MATPKIIGGFRVLQELQVGSGSQGTVYKAVCETAREGIAAVGDVVALKVMAVQDDGQTLWRRLEQRTQELVALDHPNVVRYKGCFMEAGPFADIHVVVQEFLDGETLKDCLAHNPGGLDVDRGLDIVKASLDGLIYTTGKGIVHRDLKPGNIFLCRDGSVKLIDFEIARREGGTATTATGNIRGSFDYMAPDFINATFHGDVQSDIFSMGVVLHEVLTGKTPYQRFNGDRKQANFAFLSRWSHNGQEGGESPIHISSRVKRLLAGADEILVKSLSQDRAARYTDFSTFRNDLNNVRFRDLRNGSTAYRLLQYIGKGGFGEVFKARSRQTGELVAVKHLLKAAYAERFFREAKIMQKLQALNDSCFVRFIDFFVSERAGGKDAFLVMAFLDGMPGNSLRDAIRASNSDSGERLPKLDVLLAFRRYALGLQAMHVSGIFHRDIKPSNLYYPEGHPERAAIMDLGIARDVNGTATTGQVPGTLDYMPPEVVVSDSRGDSGMDIYALGLCLYEALTGKMGYTRLPTGTAAYTAFFARARENKPPTFDAPPVVGDHRLLELLLSMTRLDADKRLKDIGTVISTLDALIEEAGGADSRGADASEADGGSETLATTMPTGGTMPVVPYGYGHEMGRGGRSRKLWAWVGSVLLLAAAGVGGAFYMFGRQKPANTPSAHSLGPVANGTGTTTAKDYGGKPVGYVKFQLGTNLVCRFRDEEIKTSDAILIETGRYECVYYNMATDENGKRKYSPYHVEFAVTTGSIARVEIPLPWRDGTAHGAAETNAVSETLAREKVQQEQAAKEKADAQAKAERAKQERLKAEEERKRTEQERKQAEDAAAAAAAEAKRLKEEMARLKAETERLKREAEEAEAARKRQMELERLASMSNNAARAELKKRLEEEARIAREKEEKERKEREERERAWREKAGTDATNSFWTLVAQLEPVATRKRRLLDAEAIYRTAVMSNLLETSESSRLSDALFARRGWIVGRIANKCPDPVEVAGRSIAPSASELFVMTNGLPQHWEARRAGFEPLQLTRQFDGQEISLDASSFVMGVVEITIPALSDGIACLVDGEVRSGVLKRKPGQTLTYAYRRRGYTYRGPTSYAVTASSGQKLPEPSEADWALNPVQVWVPRLAADVSCWVDGRALAAGGVMTNMPGSKIACTYRRKGYKDVQKSHDVMLADYQELPTPKFAEWEILPVNVSVPKLPDGVTCWVDGKQTAGNLVRKPGERIVAKYRLKGYTDVDRSYLVTMDEGQSLPVPAAADWVPLAVQVVVPVLPEGVTCWIDNRQVTGALSRHPGQKVTVSYRRDGYEELQKVYDVTFDAKQSLPPPAQNEWKQQASGGDASDLLEQVEMYYADKSWKQVLRGYVDVKKIGYKLSADDLNMVENAYANERANIKTIRERVLREMSVGKSPSYDLAKLEEEESQLHEWYNAIKK